MRRYCAVLIMLAVAAGSSFAQNKLGAERIAKEVRHELVMLPYYDVFDNLAFKVDGSTVTLMGSRYLAPGAQMSKISRRKLVTTGLAAAAGVSGLAAAASAQALWTGPRPIAAESTVPAKR